MRKLFGGRLLATTTIGLLTLGAAGAHAAPEGSASDRRAETLPGRYIVVYKDSVERVGRATDRRERALGFDARHRYRSAVKGFSAALSRGQLKRLRRDRAVDFVAPDRPVHAVAQTAAEETVPTGIRRIEAGSATTVRGASGVGVAVIDTGIDPSHPDLQGQIAGGKNCIDQSKSPADDHGHGTHVAGTVAAANNGSGVVGVAPGTQLFSLKVLDKGGSGSTSSVVCGIDWVAQNAANENIRVANMSLGGAGDPVRTCSTTTDPEHIAICNATAAGVVFAVAAGNSGWDFDYEPMPDIPAAYPEVVTVTAMADSDGSSGGAGSRCDREYDDRYASFSNYALTSAGKAHTVAAPGVCITSTALGGGTTSMSGTSMASPHAAGAIALCIAEGSTSGPCAGLAANQPAQLIAELTKNRESAYGFYGDPNQPAGSRYFGYLGWVGLSASEPVAEEPAGDTAAPAAPTTLVASGGDGLVALDWADNAESDLAGYNVYRSTTSGTGYAKLNGSPVTGSAYTDTAVSNGTTYYYVVTALDTSGNESGASAEATATPQAPSSEPSTDAIALSATGYKVKGVHHADLAWSGATTTQVDVYRNGTLVATTKNDGAHTDKTGNKGGGSYTYKLCEAASTTACSAEVVVGF